MSQCAQHQQWLLALTGTPTAAGREQQVIEWVERWVRKRPNLSMRRDGAGNMIILVKGQGRGRRRPVYLTAHLDHPAFVVRAAPQRGLVELEFRGGVLDPYFVGAQIEIVTAEHGLHQAPRARIERLDAASKPYKRVTARLLRGASGIEPGDIGRWVFRGTGTRGNAPRVVDGILYAPACDDLAGVAAALCALDVLRRRRGAGAGNVGVLLTRAEEVGFVGAIAACKERSVPRDARLLCLENSRSFAESPIGAGPILRVGDAMTVFSPGLTNRLGLLLEAYRRNHPGFAAQRRLMPGGTCEASTFAAYGWEATCLCLPLGNYHNMVDIDGVKAGKRPARVGPEHIALADFHGLVELLIHFAAHLDSEKVPSIASRMDERYRTQRRVLEG